MPVIFEDPQEDDKSDIGIFLEGLDDDTIDSSEDSNLALEEDSFEVPFEDPFEVPLEVPLKQPSEAPLEAPAAQVEPAPIRPTRGRRTVLDLLLEDASPIIGASNNFGSITPEAGPRRSLRVLQQTQPAMGSGWAGSGQRHSLRVTRRMHGQSLSNASSGSSNILSCSCSRKKKKKARGGGSRRQKRTKTLVARMSNAALFIELCSARDIYMAKRECRLLVIRQFHHQWHQRQLSNVLVEVKSGFKRTKKRRKKLKRFLRAITQYTGPQFEAMNAFLRAGKIRPGRMGERLKQTVQQAIAAFNIGLRGGNYLKLCPKDDHGKDKPLYRGSGSIPMALEAGGTFCDKSFLSTSQKKETAVNFLRRGTPTERILFSVTRHCNGVDVLQLSKHRDEAEVLFAPNTMFRIAKVEREQTVDNVGGTVTLVELHEMV